jgi:hypothetical protein
LSTSTFQTQCLSLYLPLPDLERYFALADVVLSC